MERTQPGGLSGIQLLAHLAPEELRRLASQCAWWRYAAGERILSRDSDSRDVFFVIRGTVEVSNYASSGREVALSRIPAGSYFGELAAIDGKPRSANVVAADECVVAAMPPTVFEALLRERPEVRQGVLRRLAGIIRVCNERIMDLSTLGAGQRIVIELLRLARPDAAVPRLRSIYPMPIHADIASHASTTRETVARVLSQLGAQGLVLRKGDTLYLQAHEQLMALADRRQRDEPFEGADRRRGAKERWYEEVALIPKLRPTI